MEKPAVLAQEMPEAASFAAHGGPPEKPPHALSALSYASSGPALKRRVRNAF
jgi:hypothetical protein